MQNDMTNNTRLLERSLAAVWHPCTQMKHHSPDDQGAMPMIPIAHGKGSWLYDFDGKRYLDGISSWWVNLFVHANPRINAALKNQLDELEHVILAGFTHKPVIELSERLSALTAHTLGHCFFASDGASATEIALKMSVHAWRNRGLVNKNQFLCLEGGYHGETAGALAVTDVELFRAAYGALIRPASALPSPDARLAEKGQSPADRARLAANALHKYLQEHHQKIAALIVEPLIQCAGSMAMYDKEYLSLVRAICNQYQVHLICDEIAVGCGRTGTFFAHEQANIRPDFLCLSKGITGGYLPLSIVMTTDEIYGAFYDDQMSRAFLHSHSYTGNALACRAALATLDIFEEDNILEKNRETAKKLKAALEPLRTHPQVKHLRQRGMIIAFDVDTKDPAFARAFYREALAREALIRPLGNTIYLMPPYTITDDEIAYLGKATTEALAEALNRS